MAARGLVDWGLAERIGSRLAARPSSLAGELPELQRDMSAQAPLAEALVTATTGLVPTGPADVQVVDRPAWVAANIASFRRLLGPLLSRWEERVGNRAGVANEVTSRVAAVELGSLLGWMSGRVLGQYDLLLSDQPGGDIVYLVGPNLIGRPSLDGQRMDALRDQPKQGIIHEAVSRHPAHTSEARAGY